MYALYNAIHEISADAGIGRATNYWCPHGGSNRGG
jgi:hypothetical protein